jgi:hypothetical protein
MLASLAQNSTNVKFQMRYITLPIVLMFSGCLLVPRSFEITKLKAKVEGEQLAIYFYTPENLTELDRSYQVQFRCYADNSEETMHGEIFIANDIFEYHSSYGEKLSKEGDRVRAGVARNVLGYKYVGIPYIELREMKQYSNLECLVIGVMKAPVPFPKSNRVTVNVSELGI